MPRTPEPQYPLIDVMRAASALLVVAYHVIVLTPWDVRLTEGVLLITHMGWIGVECFLVISGFVITQSLLREQALHPTGYRRRFAIRRLGRIAPLYLLTSVLFVLFVRRDLLAAPAEHQWLQLVTHLLFVHNLHPATAGAINGPSWTIALEMQFYVLVALLAPWLARTTWWRAAAVFVGAAIGYRWLVSLVLVPGAASAHLQQIYTTQLPGTLDAFGLGIALALALHHGGNRLAARLQPGWGRCTVWLALACAASFAVWSTYWAHPDYWDSLRMVLFWRLLLAMAFAFWLAAALSCPAAASVVFAPLRYLGTVSYGIYLWHMLVLLTLLKVPGLDKNHGFMMFGTMGIAIALAALSWHLFEKPLLAWAKRLSARTAASGTAPTEASV